MVNGHAFYEQVWRDAGTERYLFVHAWSHPLRDVHG